ncbi:synaptic vesicle glycoprotein 2C [Contarinia nasturtii]|uniref:synaptic vesicle glycoprotein 2C n=1 Tax=Contarinia nasturtii TaxID=265458 RepID=UPI0012D44049|nr:synaptic vesicle glycoprotein 2C [Contarinia nasturtii]XP_031628423.1 synaptic vesicle glycoprotein 2C [Contarinia nasturtii]XP_031628424.1 synaptic vesicle glycoprotein 2C [Contarinia nasturtii]
MVKSNRIPKGFLNTRTNDAEVREDDKSSENIGKYCIEDAIRATGHGRFHIFLLFVCGIGMMNVVIENVNIGFVLPYVRCEMKISTAEQGLLNSVGYIGIVISSHLWGFLADTTGRRRVLLISMVGSFICALLSAFSFNILSLILSRLFVGFFVSGVQAATYSYIGEFHSNETRTKTLSFVAMFMPACFVYLPLLAWAVLPMEWEFHLSNDIKISPWRIYLLLSSLLNGINAICLYHLPESPKFLLSINRKEETLNVLRKMHSVNIRDDQKLYPVKDLISETTGTALSEVCGIYGIFKLVWCQTLPCFQRPNVLNTSMLCYLMFCLFSVGHGTFMWYPDFLMQMQDYIESPYTLCNIVGSSFISAKSFNLSFVLNDSSASIDRNEYSCVNHSNTVTFKIILMMGVVFVSISAVVSFYINKVNRKMLLIGWLLISSVFSVSIVFIRNFYLMAVGFMTFLSCGLCGGIISAISITIFPTNIRAMATCLILMFGRLGAVGGSNFVGFLLNGHCELIFYLYGLLILSCSFVCFFLNTNPVELSEQTRDKSFKMKCRA